MLRLLVAASRARLRAETFMLHIAELLGWLEVRGHGQFLPKQPDGDFWSLFEHEGAPLRAPPAALERASREPVDLLIVLTTYKRAHACERKLRSLPQVIARAGRALNVHVLVLSDRSSQDDRRVRALGNELFAERLTWLDARTHLGKPGFWKTYQVAFLAECALRPTHTLFLQDDVSYAATLLSDAYALRQRTAGDPRRRVIYLFSSPDDERYGRWVFRRRRKLPAQNLHLTQWFDLQGFFVDRAFFAALEHRMVPIHPNRWRRFPWLSSGVGAQLTRRLLDRANIYQAVPALLLHGAEPSQMNAQARRMRALDNERSLPGFRAVC